MKKINTHTHSTYSDDGHNSIEEIIKEAKKEKLTYLAITDHLELKEDTYSLDNTTVENIIDYFKKYKKEVLELKNNTKELYIALGIEVGYFSIYKDIAKRILEEVDGFEFILNSVHQFKNSKKYYHEEISLDKVAKYYLEIIIESFCVPYEWTTLSHLGFIIRYNNENKHINYLDYKKYYDKIFEYIIKNDKILEINSNFGKSTALSIPELDVLKAYVSQGGKLVTFGSDAHTKDRLTYNYEVILHILNELGLKEFAIIKNKKIEFINPNE